MTVGKLIVYDSDYVMTTKQKALKIIEKKGEISPRELSEKASVSRQQASKVIGELKGEGKLIRVGSGPKTKYIVPENNKFSDFKYEKEFENENLKEDRIVSSAKLQTPFLKKLPGNVESIFDYSFSEMINNAIDHSESKKIKVEAGKEENFLTFVVRDFGIGVFENIMQNKGLNSEMEAIQDLLKGKTTTMPEAHSGEGIFFTSKIADIFILESFDYRLQVDNMIDDVFVAKKDNSVKGTRVIFRIDSDSEKKLEEVFKNYQSVETEYGFDKTEIVVNLYQSDVDYVSRSQARRVLVGLEKFKKVIFDFKDISGIGQAFADEIFRVFQNRNPNMNLEYINTNEAVKFMIERVKNN